MELIRREWKSIAVLLGGYLILYFIPLQAERVNRSVFEALYLTQWYTREHVLLCLVPAFFIAGGITVFITSDAVMKYLGAKANKVLAFGVASVSGTILAVCSCTVLPLFAGIYKRGAGLGPATAFLYSGPAINVLAIILTARVLGFDLGVARAVGAILFSVIVGLFMHLLFRKGEAAKADGPSLQTAPAAPRPLYHNILYFGAMVAVLVFANLGKPATAGVYAVVWGMRWYLTAAAAVLFGVVAAAWFAIPWWKLSLTAVGAGILAVLFPQTPALAFSAGALGLAVAAASSPGEPSAWFDATWDFAKQIFPLLLGGVLLSGFLLGRPGEEGLVPSSWVAAAVGGNSLQANFFASLAGALMYFATLTEVPVVQGLLGAGMGKGPALALLLAGPALSLPNMLVINSIMGPKKTAAFITAVVILSTAAGMIFGALGL